MRTVQISLGEIIEAIYGEVVESSGDAELALATAHAISNDLVADVPAKRARTTTRSRRR
ncbi:MAG: hypothetical protein AB7O24_00340 [Kofleriaceae bacterium]